MTSKCFKIGWKKRALQLNYGWSVAVLSREILERFSKRIQEIPAMRNIPSDFVGKWSSVKVEALKNTGDLEKFKQATLWIKTQI